MAQLPFIFEGSTTDATPTELFSSEGERLTLDENTAYRIEGTAIAVNTTTLAMREWEFSALVRNVAGVVSQVGDIICTDLRGSTGTEAWVLTLTPSSSPASLQFFATGEVATDIDWRVEGNALRLNVDGTPAAISGYCSLEDLENRLGTATLAQLTNDAANATLPDTDVVQALVERADRMIDSILGTLYDVPFTTTIPEPVRRISIDLTCYFAMQRRFQEVKMPDDWKRTYDSAMEYLDRLASAEAHLDNDISFNSEFLKIDAPDAQLNFNDTSSQVSDY